MKPSFTKVGEFIITGDELDDHTMGELEQTIWERLESLQDNLDKNYSCKDHWNNITQGDMKSSKLRVRLVLESGAERFDDE